MVFPYHDRRKADIGGHRWRDAHLIDSFGSRSDIEHILIVDRPVSRAERMIRRSDGFARGRTVAERVDRGSRARITAVDARIDVLDIHVPDLIGPLALRRGWWFRTFTDPRVLDHIRWASALQATPPHVVAWMPTVAPAIAAIEPSGVVFDSLDNWMIHPTLRRDASLAERGYAAILPSATGVVASAPASREVLLRWARRVEVIPNGVDPRAFRGPHARPVDLPPGPIVGYAGSLASRIDAELIADVARSLPAVSFIFIGPTFDTSAITPMRRVPNIHLMGDRHYGDLPAYLANFDVAWIPHRVGSGETGGDPIKMYEYWAAGREVVATRIDGLDAWGDRLHLVGDAESATTEIRGLLDGSIRPKHATVPPDRTWDAIAEQIVGLFGDSR